MSIWERILYSITDPLSKRGKPATMSAPLVAICVGHSRLIHGQPEGGAVSVGGISEWRYNSRLAPLIAAHLREHRCRAVIFERYEGDGYGAAQRWLAGQLKNMGVACAVELHFNASDSPDANGHEMLYWHSSKNGKRLATGLEEDFNLAIPIKARGIKPKTSADRGAEFLSGTHCPAVIVESFFGSNLKDWSVAEAKRDAIARAIGEGILSYFD